MRRIGRWATAAMSLLRLTRRADTLVLVCVTLLVGVVAAGLVAAERAVDVAEDDSLAQALANAPAETTRLVVEIADVFTPSGPTDPLVVPRRKLDSAGTAIDPLVSSVYVDPRLVLDTPRFTVRTVDGKPVASPTTAVLRVQPGLDSHASRVEGVEPARTDTLDGIDVIEVSLSTGAAEELGWSVGSELLVTPTTDDPLFRGFDTLPDPFVIRVAGLLELDDPTEPFWFGDDRLHRVIVDDTGLGADLTVHASIPEAQLPVVLATLGGQAALRVEERRDLDPTRVDMSNVVALERAVRATEARTTTTAAFGSAAVRFGLGDVLAAEAVRRGTASDAIHVAAIGVIAAAVAAFLQLLRAAADRRRPWWVQVRARGANPSAMAAGSLVATSAAVAVGVLAGAQVGRSLVGGAASTPSGGVALFAVMLVLTDLVLQIGDAHATLDRSGTAGSSRWRRAGATVVVALAVASVVSLRRSGIVADGGGGGGGNDLLVVLPLALVPIAVAVVAVAGLSALHRGRAIGGLDLGVGRVVGLRRAAEMRSAPSFVVAVALAACVATVSATIAWWLRSTSTGAAGGPLGDVARNAFVAAASAAWLLCVAGVAIATVITMRRRRRDAELLSALGADRSEFRRAVSAELTPLVGFGLVIAAVAAWITVTALEGRLDLDVLRVPIGGTDPSIGVERRGVVAPLMGTTFAVMGSLFVVAVGVVRLAVARMERSQRVAGEAGPR